MRGGPIEEVYFNWLCAKVLDANVRIYSDLMRILHCKEFVWINTFDENREEDGLELRNDFLRVAFRKNESEWYNQPCSVLELLIALAQRASFQTDMPVSDWFWRMLNNLNLDEYRQVSDSDISVIDEILDIFIWRTYDSKGNGSLFPMRWPKEDMRQVELYYQFCEYVQEQGLF